MIAEDNNKAGWNSQQQVMGRNNIPVVLILLVVLVALELELECKQDAGPFRQPQSLPLQWLGQ